MSRKRRSAGFTLIELLIVVVIVGVLGALAIPGYTSWVLRSHRTDAKTALTLAAQSMERYFTQNNTYANAVIGSTGGIFNSTSSNGYYTISFLVGSTSTATNTNATGYVLEAVPVGRQATDSCGTYTLDQANTRGAATANCW